MSMYAHIMDTFLSEKRGIPFSLALLEQVKSHPILWDSQHKDRKHRKKVADAWREIATTLDGSPLEMKSKWRNMKDTFHRETKKVNPSTEATEESIMSNYTGKWYFFDKLLFLWDSSRHLRNEQDGVYVYVTEPDIQIDDIKGEIDVSDPDDVYDDEDDGADGLHFKDDGLQESGNDASQNISDSNLNDKAVKRKDTETSNEDQKQKKQRYDVNSGIIDDQDIDEDLCFAKSIVPFMRRLNPVRKLILRNEITSLLLKEIMCNRCKSLGPQPDCKCHFG